MAQCLPVSERVVPLPLLLLAACRFLQSLHEHPAVTSNFSVFEGPHGFSRMFLLAPTHLAAYDFTAESGVRLHPHAHLYGPCPPHLQLFSLCPIRVLSLCLLGSQQILSTR